jgi:hypothetical protein
MLVSEIAVLHTDEYSQLQARVESDGPMGVGSRFQPFTLWYRFPPWCRPFLRESNGDPFLAALLVPAMIVGESLTIPADVSPSLLRRLPDIQSIYACFDNRLHPIDVETRIRATTPDVTPEAVGLFLSLGVDSFYSLLKNLRDHPADDETITHLIGIHDFHVTYGEWDERFLPRMLENCERVARETNKTLIPVVTNLRPITRPVSDWSLSHGGALASVALALDGFLRQIAIAATTTYDQLYPWGSHPVLDPLWSTETMQVIHDGCEMNRIDKVGAIARSRLVLETLRVCPDYNCGQCIKCLPTIIDLMVAGALDRCATLPHNVNVARLREVFRDYEGQLNVENYARRLATLPAEAPPDLREALTEFVAGEPTGPGHRPPRRRGAWFPFPNLSRRRAG